MQREFVIAQEFDEQWERLGLTDDDLRNLQNILLNNPKTGVVIPGLDGARKMRLSFKTHGKSGGIRIIYVDVVIKKKIFLITVYPKNVQENLTPTQKKVISTLVRHYKEI